MRAIRVFLASALLSLSALASLVGASAAPARADTAPGFPYTIHIDLIPQPGPLLTVCATVKEADDTAHCFNVPNVTDQTVNVPVADVDAEVVQSSPNILSVCVTINELNFGPDCAQI